MIFLLEAAAAIGLPTKAPFFFLFFSPPRSFLWFQGTAESRNLRCPVHLHAPFPPWVIPPANRRARSRVALFFFFFFFSLCDEHRGWFVACRSPSKCFLPLSYSTAVDKTETPKPFFFSPFLSIATPPVLTPVTRSNLRRGRH